MADEKFGFHNSPQGAGHGETESDELGHVPVLLKEAIDFLAVRRGGTYLDATVGLGGHSYEIARRLGREGRLIGLDKDPGALQAARRRLSEPAQGLESDWPEIRMLHASFAEISEQVGRASLSGILADLGLSSLQLADAARGFSFQAEGPLDMRMDPRQRLTADQVVNRLDERRLADVIYEFGEERRSRRIARAIVRARPIRSTAHLAEVISAALRPMKSFPGSGKEGRPERIHPATRTFQAIRIYVNRELEDLGAMLQAAPSVLQPGGRLVVVSFHSLEDRAVKEALRRGEGEGIYRLLTRKPVMAGAEEMDRNPRSRSAKLRAAERMFR